MTQGNEAANVFVGVDVGKSFHHAVALSERGDVLLDQRLTNDEADIADVLRELLTLGEVLVVVDQSADIGAFPIAVAKASGAAVAYLPGHAMRRLAELHPGNAKTDRKDARVIAEAARTLPHALRPIRDEALALADLRVLTSFDDDLATEVNRTTNRLRALLTRVHPHLERVVGPRLSHPAVLDLLQRYPSPERLERAGTADIGRALLPRAPKLGPRLAEDIADALAAQTIVVPGTRGASAVVLRLAEQLQTIRRQRDEIADQVGWIVEHHPLYPLLASMPGVGVATSARILTEVYGRDFRSSGHLAAFVGVAPVTRRSGTSIRRDRRSERGNRPLKRALHLSAWTAIHHDPASRAYFDRKLAEGKRPNEAIAALVRRRLDVLYAMLRDARPYHAAPSDDTDTGPVDAPRVRRIHRAKRPSSTLDRAPTSQEYEWFVARLRSEGTFLCRLEKLPRDTNEFRQGLREAARHAGIAITTTVHGSRFFAEATDFHLSEAQKDLFADAMGDAMARELGLRVSAGDGASIGALAFAEVLDLEEPPDAAGHSPTR